MQHIAHSPRSYSSSTSSTSPSPREYPLVNASDKENDIGSPQSKEAGGGKGGFLFSIFIGLIF